MPLNICKNKADLYILIHKKVCKPHYQLVNKILDIVCVIMLLLKIKKIIYVCTSQSSPESQDQ